MTWDLEFGCTKVSSQSEPESDFISPCWRWTWNSACSYLVVCEVDQSTGISCHTGVLPHIVVMTHPLICTPSLFMPCPWEHVLCLYPSNMAGNVFYHLKYLLFSTFLCYRLCSFFQHCKLSPILCVNLELTWEKCSKTWNCVTAFSSGPCAHHIIMSYLQLISDLLGYAHHSVVITAMQTNTPHCGMWILLNYWVSDHRVWIVYVCVRIFHIFWEERSSYCLLYLNKTDLSIRFIWDYSPCASTEYFRCKQRD